MGVSRTLYGGAVVEESLLPLPCVVTIAPGRYEASCGSASQRGITIERDDRVELISEDTLDKEGVDLSAAKAIVAVGMGVEKREDLAMINELADKLGAQLGCTRGIAEERCWLPVEQYVGLSGVSVAPDLYLTVGVSGQVQHLVGMRDSKVVVAIDKNENAPIFNACDYGIVGDLYKVVPLLTQALG